jgi:FAD/FMN-containing dehydrogenase
VEPWEETLAQADELAEAHRNFEFYYIPFADRCMLSTHDITTEEKFSTPTVDPNEGVMELKMARDYLGWSDFLRGLPLAMVMDGYEKEVSVEASWLNYASERNVRFNEMEYHLPRESGLQALREVRAMLEGQHDEVFFPLEVRYVSGDDVWLSPFYQRDSISIAVHRFHEEDYRPYFASIESIFRRHGGRPHWGKLNTMQADDFRAHYPHWDEFSELRRQMDPGGKFLNPYLETLFGGAS